MEQTPEDENWMNEHGEPDIAYLNNLASSNEPGALEKLQSIAEDLDVECHESDSATDIVEKIRSAAEMNESVDPIVTS